MADSYGQGWALQCTVKNVRTGIHTKADTISQVLTHLSGDTWQVLQGNAPGGLDLQNVY